MKCGKVKNPCKICFQSVSNKNGLQCKGACKKWAHFKCLNYTPGKISDIKAGLIKVSCPCPDCTTSEPKEVLTDPPFTCVNEGCPATKRPSCESPECPSKDKPIPSFPPHVKTGPETPDNCLPPAPVPKCVTPPLKKSPCPSPPRKPSPPRQASPRPASPPRRPGSPPLKITVVKRRCPPCPDHCPKRSDDKIVSKPPSPQRSQSCSLNSKPSNHSGKSHIRLPASCSSDTALITSQDQKMFYGAIEEMCDTVGQLSNQMKDLMCKMTNTFHNKDKKKF